MSVFGTEQVPKALMGEATSQSQSPLPPGLPPLTACMQAPLISLSYTSPLEGRTGTGHQENWQLQDQMLRDLGVNSAVLQGEKNRNEKVKSAFLADTLQDDFEDRHGIEPSGAHFPNGHPTLKSLKEAVEGPVSLSLPFFLSHCSVSLLCPTPTIAQCCALHFLPCTLRPDRTWNLEQRSRMQ